MTLLSVCIPLHKPDSSHLRELLDSVALAAGEVDVEIILSLDQAPISHAVCELLDEVAAQETVTVVKGVPGMAANWNNAVSQASGKFFLLPGQDDRLLSDTLIGLLDFAESTALDIAFASEQYIDTTGVLTANPSRVLNSNRFFPPRRTKIPSESVVAAGLMYGNIFGDPCCALVRKQTFDEVGGFDPVFLHSTDLDFWMRAAAHGSSLGRAPETSSQRRLHTGNATRTHVRDGLAGGDRLRLFRRFERLVGDDVANRALARLHTHDWFDRVRGGAPEPGLKEHSFRGGGHAALAAYRAEVLELLHLRRPKPLT